MTQEDSVSEKKKTEKRNPIHSKSPKSHHLKSWQSLKSGVCETTGMHQPGAKVLRARTCESTKQVICLKHPRQDRPSHSERENDRGAAGHHSGQTPRGTALGTLPGGSQPRRPLQEPRRRSPFPEGQLVFTAEERHRPVSCLQTPGSSMPSYLCLTLSLPI